MPRDHESRRAAGGFPSWLDIAVAWTLFEKAQAPPPPRDAERACPVCCEP